MMKDTNFAVIFDMDGVIFDSERAYIDAFKRITDGEQLPFLEEACIECIGVTWENTKAIFERHYGPEFDFPYYYHKVREYLAETPFDLKPGVYELFRYLKERAVPIALASSTTESSVRRMLAQAGLIEYFDALICGDMVRRSKPHPDIFLTAADALGTEPGRCYVIEDSYNGIRAAYAAGMHPLMVPDILQPNDEIRPKCEQVFPSLKETLTYIKSLS